MLGAGPQARPGRRATPGRHERARPTTRTHPRRSAPRVALRRRAAARLLGRVGARRPAHRDGCRPGGRCSRTSGCCGSARSTRTSRALTANMTAWNRWCASVVADGRGRVHPVAHLTLRDDAWLDARAGRARTRRRAPRDDRARARRRPSALAPRSRPHLARVRASTASRRCSTSPTSAGVFDDVWYTDARRRRAAAARVGLPLDRRPRSRAPISSSTARSNDFPSCASASSSCRRCGCRCS